MAEETKTNAAVEYEVEEAPEGWVDIAEAAEITGYQQQYVRKLLREGGKLTARKIQRKGYKKWMIDPESLKAYQAGTGVRGGLRRYILRMDTENEDVARAALEELEIEFTLELQYKPKAEAEATEPEVEAVEPEVTAADETLDFLNE